MSIIETLRRVRDDESAIRRHFELNSPVMKAIQDHILNVRPCQLIEFPVDDYGQELEVRRGGSHPFVSFVDASANHRALDKENRFYELDKFELKVKVVFQYDYETYGEETFLEKIYTFGVPIDLEERFFFTRWESWIHYEGLKQRDSHKFVDIPKLKRLMAKYPEEVKKFIAEAETA